MNASTVVTNNPHSVSVVSASERPNITDERGMGKERRRSCTPVVAVLGDTRTRGHPEPQDPGHEESRDEEVDVVEASTGLDGAAEDVAEHEEEQRALHRSQHEQLRRAEELEDRSLRALERSGDEVRRRSRAGSSTSSETPSAVVVVSVVVIGSSRDQAASAAAD